MDDWETCILSNRLLFDRASIPHKFNTCDIARLNYKHKSKINGRLVEVLWFSHLGEYLVKHLGFKNVTSWVKEEYLEPVILWRKNHDQSPEPESTDKKEYIAELSEDALIQIYEMLGIEPPMTIKWGAEHPDDSIRFGAHTKEYLQKANADANAILNLLHKLGYTDVPIRPILELISIGP